ncbi:MAG: hypothetical protein MI861_13490 [Pirellulales bacterium]|nr:hypothetical protein [Pirellulales bacterium]
MANEFERLAEREAELSAAVTSLTRELQRANNGNGSLATVSPTQLSGQQDGDSAAVVEALQAVRRSTDELDQGVGENTKALRDTAAAFGSGVQGLLSGLGGGIGGDGGLGSLLKSGFGLGPLASGVARLFGGGGEREEPVLPTLETPPARDSSLANSPGPVQALRQVERGAGDSVRTTSPAQVVVNVSAMDARGFLDRSDDIAAAVRDAMLRMHAVNDVVEEL